MSKLTLSVNERVISGAKRYAKEHGVSVSKLVETYLARVAEGSDLSDAVQNTPILRSLRGSLKKADLAAYRKHLVAKYR